MISPSSAFNPSSGRFKSCPRNLVKQTGLQPGIKEQTTIAITLQQGEAPGYGDGIGGREELEKRRTLTPLMTIKNIAFAHMISGKA